MAITSVPGFSCMQARSAIIISGVSIGESEGMADEFSLMENRGKLSFEKIIDAAIMSKVFLWILKSTGFVQGLREQIALRDNQVTTNLA